MSVDDTLELDTIIEEGTSGVTTVADGTEGTDFNLDIFNTKTEVFDPIKSGTYNLNINGQQLTVKVTKLNTVPDRKDLQAQYDATKLSYNDGDKVSTWFDESETSYDLTEGNSPTYKSDIINGNPVVRFDGSNDYLNVEWSKISQPYHIFTVFRVRRVPVGKHNYPLSNNSDNNSVFSYRSGSSFGWRLNSGTHNLDGGSVDKNTHIGNFLFNGSSSSIRIDSKSISEGNAGSNGLKGLKIGTHPDNILHAKIDFGEILIYPQNKIGSQSEIENYLSSKW